MTLTSMTPLFERTGVDHYLEWHETGFGDDPLYRARFAHSNWPEWELEVIRSERAIPGTRRVKRQTTAWTPLRVTYENVVINDANYAKMYAMLDTVNTLYLPVGATTFADDYYDDGRGNLYVIMRNVHLLQMTGGLIAGEGRRRVTLSFVRDDVGDLYGFSQLTPEE